MARCEVVAAGKDAEVDIMTMEDEPYFSSDEEEEQRQQLHYLPVLIHKAARPADKYGFLLHETTISACVEDQ